MVTRGGGPFENTNNGFVVDATKTPPPDEQQRPKGAPGMTTLEKEDDEDSGDDDDGPMGSSFPELDYLQELIAIQKDCPKEIGFFGTRNMDPRSFRDEEYGSARFFVRKAWIRALFGSTNMDPRVFRVGRFESARFKGCSGVITGWIRPVRRQFGAGSALARRGIRAPFFQLKNPLAKSYRDWMPGTGHRAGNWETGLGSDAKYQIPAG